METFGEIKRRVGDGDADIVRNIVIAWLSEKSFISTTVKIKVNYDENKP